MYQLAQIGVYALLYASLAYFQITVVEHVLLKRIGWGHWIVRPIFSLFHAALGFAVFLALLLTANVVMSGDYRRGWLDPYGMIVVPVVGGVFGVALPWLPLVRGDNPAA